MQKWRRAANMRGQDRGLGSRSDAATWHVAIKAGAVQSAAPRTVGLHAARAFYCEFQIVFGSVQTRRIDFNMLKAAE
jgi:hypothetical protein